MIKSTDKSGRR